MNFKYKNLIFNIKNKLLIFKILNLHFFLMKKININKRQFITDFNVIWFDDLSNFYLAEVKFICQYKSSC